MILTCKHETPWMDEGPLTNAKNAYAFATHSLNRLTGLTNTNSGSFGFGYDALGRRTSLARPNGVNTSYSYDTLSRLLSVLHNEGALPGSASYTYDAAGNRLTKTAVQEASPNPVSVLSQYSYDPIYELTQAVVNSSVAESYSYDPVGNRLTSTGPTSYNYNASNELTSTSSAAYTYDNNGNTISNTTSAGTTSYTWDFENRLASVTLPGTGGTVNFKYDPFGRRIEKIAPTTGTAIYAYDGDNVTEELGGGGNLLAYYTQGTGIDEPLAVAGSGGTYYYHPDGLGSITSLTNGSGQLAASYVYDSFGNLTASTGTITNPFQYTGREFDPETGKYYYRARYYDPTIGRFIREDPIALRDGVNLYIYVHNGPPTSTDPQGLYQTRGFTGAQEAQIYLAVGEAMLQLGTTCCAGKDGPKIANALWNATIVYNPKEADCGGTGLASLAGGFLGFHHVFTLGPSAFGPGCCSLTSVVAHEAYHLLDATENSAYGLEQKCFGCPDTRVKKK